LKFGKLVSATALPSLGSKDVGRQTWHLPTKKEQCAISSVFLAMDKEIDISVHRLRKAKNIKQGMMQELLTGRTRLV